MNRRCPRSILTLAFVLAFLLFTAGCARERPLDYWFVDSLVKVFPDAGFGHEHLPAAAFDAARNGNLSIQLCLRANRAVGDLYVDALPLTGPGMPIESVSVRWVKNVVVTSNTPQTPPEELVRQAPALFPDALLEDFPITVPAATTRCVWITVRVDAAQRPGVYEGVLRLRQGRDALELVPYTVKVHSATVPSPIPLAISNYLNLSERHTEQFYGCSRFSEAWWELIRNYAGFFGRYHQTVVRGSPVALAQVTVRGGRLHYDFSNFIRYVEMFQAYGVNGQVEGSNLARRERLRNAPVMIPAWVIENGQAVQRDVLLSDPRAERFLNTFLPALYQVLEAHGWAEKYLQGILDEPHESEQPAFIRIGRLVRRLMPGVRTIEPVSARQDLAFLEKTVDIWVPHLGSIGDKLDQMRAHLPPGGELWFYTALSPRGHYPNRFIDYSLLKVRLLHWINFKYDLRGYLHWGGNYWGPRPYDDTQPVINQGRTYLPPGDAYITYPNRAGRSLYSSIRLEQMREGIEDFGLLHSLAQRDQARAADIAGQMVTSFTDYVRDPKRFRELRLELLESF